MCGCISGDADDPTAGMDAGTDCDASTATCPLADLAVRLVHEKSGKPVVKGHVTVDGLGTKESGIDGWATWEKIKPGTYDASGRKDGYDPDPGQQSGIVVPEHSKTTAEIKLSTPELHLHVDNDRDGTINDDWDQNDKWETGTGKKGTVIRVNNDDEDRDKKTDWENDIVDTGSDVPDIAPLHLRKAPKGKKFPAGWKAVLSVSDKDRIRIFDNRAAGGKEVIGPAKGATFDITDLGPDEWKMGMEATSYPDLTFDGRLALTLKLFDDTGAEVHSEDAQVRVSPWLMFHHGCVTTKVYVVQTSDNATFRVALSAAVTAAGKTLQKAAKANYADDRWMQDVMEPGFSSLPGTGAPNTHNMPVTIRTGNYRSPQYGLKGKTEDYARDDLLGPDYGFTQALPPAAGSSLDSFGNLECSPPFVHTKKGRDYKFGRIVYGAGGRTMLPKVRQFLTEQKAQEPFEIDTDWLVVGHVDEVMSFLPLPAAPKKFKVMLASPTMALNIVKAAPSSAKLLHGIHLIDPANAGEIAAAYPLSTAGAITGDAAFAAEQATVQGKIDGIKATLKTELDLADTDFIDLPVLFKEEGGRHVAYTPGVVNMLVITKSPSDLVLCVPKPFGPIVGGVCQFEKKVRAQLKRSGAKIVFIDDFTTYHMLYGEIHCGTNSQREAPSDRWWWELDWM